MSLTKADPNKQGWEDSEFPILCETCLGDNPYVRMSRQSYGKQCKICERPFTVFRWLPGTNMRYKKTEICQYCAKLKNVCQTCIFDLQYGLPVQVRDEALGIKPDAPVGEVNRKYHAQNLAQKLDEEGKSAYDTALMTPENRDKLKQLARSEPYYKRNQPRICSFYVKGECNRGDECPYRHEKPASSSGHSSQQNIKDRYYGNNDPLANKIASSSRSANPLTPPKDTSVTSLFITGVTPDITEEDIRGFFYAFGEIKSITVSHPNKCAFVNYLTRSSAEVAALKIADVGLVLKDITLKVTWAKPKPINAKSAKGVRPAPPSMKSADNPAKYPSQAPTSQGSAV